MLINGNRSGKLFTVVFYQTISLIIYMLIGVIVKVKGYFTKQVNVFLGWFLTNIALPSAILRSFQMEYTAQIKKLMLTSLLYSIVFIIGTLGLSYLFCVIFKRKYVERRMWVCCFTFSSILFIGMPIVEALYGEKGLIVLVIFNTVANLVLFTIGIMIFSNRYHLKWKQVVRTPAIIAALVGATLFVWKIPIPNFMYNSLKYLGDMTVPLSMILNGALFYSSNIKKVFLDVDNLLFSFIRLIIFPIIIIVIMKFVTDNYLLIGIVALISGMPTGALNAVFAEEYAQKGEKVSQYITVSTIISMFSLPIIMLFL